MPVSPAACERITSTLSQLIRTGRHISARAAAQIYGDLPSFGWTLLVPLEREGEQRCSTLAARAGVDVSVVSRQVAALERAGYVERRPDPRDGRASLFRNTPVGLTRIVNLLRDLLASTASTLIVTNLLDIEATVGSIGSAQRRLPVDL